MDFNNNNTYTYKEPKGPKMKINKDKAKKGIMLVVAVFIVAVLGFNSFFTIKEQEQAVVTTFGVPKAVTDPGLHFKIPFVQGVRKVDTTIKGIKIGYNDYNESIEDESLMITSDFNFINVDFFLEYKVTDPVKKLYASKEPEFIIKTIAQSCIRNVVGSYDVDSVLTTGKGEFQSVIKERIMKRLEEEDIGLYLVNITIQDSEPPTAEVLEAFTAVEAAKQGKETSINNANKYRNEKLPESQAKVDKIMQQAESKKQERINEAEGQVSRFNSMYEEYKKYPLITKQRMFYETMEDVLPGLKVIIESESGTTEKILPIESLVTVENGGNTGSTVTYDNNAEE